MRIEFDIGKFITARGLNKGGRAQKFTANELVKHAVPLMPFGDAGGLIDAQESSYDDAMGMLVNKHPASRYLYYGKLMVDPDTNSSWASKGVKKELTETPLKYSTERNSQAGSEWLERAKKLRLRSIGEAVAKYAGCRLG